MTIEDQNGLDNDLLSFVAGLEAREEASDGKKEKKKSFKKGTVSLSDLTRVLGDDTGFSNLKKRIHDIGAATEGSSTKLEVVAAPLPSNEQAKMEREAAFALSTGDASKWIPIIKANRKAPKIVYGPKQKAMVPAISNILDGEKMEPRNAFEAKLAEMLRKSGMDSEEGLIREEQLQMNKMTVEEVEKRYAELAKKRALLFFDERKSKQQAKIKSKSFRKHIKNEKERSMKKDIERTGASLSPEEMREEAMKAEMNRIRERMTLKTRKANQWAHTLLQKRKLEKGSREEVLQQIRDKDRLREEIFGRAREYVFDSDNKDAVGDATTGFNYLNGSDYEGSEDDAEYGTEGSDSEGELHIDNEISLRTPKRVKKALPSESEPEEDESPENEVDEIFDRVGNSESEEKFSGDEERMQARRKFEPKNAINSQKRPDSTTIAMKLPKKVQPKPTAAQPNTVDRTATKSNLFTVDDTGDKRSKGEASAKQLEMIRKAFEADDVFEEFAAAKKAEIEADAPKEVDITLPGWGSWGGIGLEPVKGKIFKREAGIVAPENRKDSKLSHVIIHERRSKRAAKFILDRPPFPYKSKEEYEKQLFKPIGKEWNMTSTFVKKIEPRVQAKVGTIIQPISMKSNNNRK